MTAGEPRVSEREARELWRRAAELQAADERKRVTRRATVPPAAEDLSLADVAGAAEGAGIEPDYVRLALAERRLVDADQIRRDRWTARSLRAVVGEKDAIEVSRVIAASPDHVLRAFQAVGSRPEFALIPEDGIGHDALVDGVLVYRLQGSSSSFHSCLSYADARVVLVTVRAYGDGARIRLRVPLFRRGLNLAVAGGLSGTTGGLGAMGGGAAGSALAGWIGTASVAVLMAPAVVGALGGAAAGVVGFRKLYGSAVQAGEGAMRRLMHAVALEAEGPFPAGSRA